MIKFLFGAAGSGKTTYIINEIGKDALLGTPSILIVPEQEAVQAERLTLELLPPSAQLELEVLNFSRLYNRVCRDLGGLCYSYVTKPMKYLMMWRALRQISPLLDEYSSSADEDPSFVSTMLGIIAELKFAGVSHEDIESAGDKLCDSEPSLSARLSDIGKIYATYEALINEKYSDSADDLSKLCDKLDEYDFFAGKNVYIDSFTSFTAVEHRIIEKIFKSAKNVTVVLPLPNPSYSDISTASIEQSLKTLKKNANRWGGHTDVILDNDNDTRPESLRYLCKNLWDMSYTDTSGAPENAQENIVLEVCSNSYGEVEAAASHILELLRGGARCNEIAIIMRDAKKYAGIIEPALERAGIPFFFSEKKDICALSPIKLILSALRIRRYNWRKSDVISHVKTGLCGFSMRSADLFEEYINTWNISGTRFTDGEWTMNPDGFSDRISERGKVILREANEMREALCEPLQRLFIMLEASENVPDMCRALYDYLVNISLEEKLISLAQKERESGDLKAAEEYATCYSTILYALADVAEALDGASLSVDELYDVLRLVFEQTQIGTIPTSIDEVTVGSASLVRSASPKYVFVLGLCEGEFPANVNDSGLLSEGDRCALSDIGIELGADADTRSSDELMFVKNAFSSARQKLYLFTSTSSIRGESRMPSLPFRRVCALFPTLCAHEFDANDLTYLCGSARSAAMHLRNIASESERASVTSAISEQIPLAATLSSSSVSTRECRVDPELIRSLVGDKIYVSPTSLEKYIKCPFSYYASYLLSLREQKYGSFRANNFGSFIHYVLEHMIRACVPSSEDSSLMSHEEIVALTGKVAEDYIKLIAPDASLNAPRMKHLYTKLKKLSVLLIENIIKEFSESDFRPAFFELKINGRDGNPQALVLPLENGAEVVLRGFIDRVDLWKDGDNVYVRIVDYKTGSKDFDLSDVALGLNTQMLLYLFSVCANPCSKIISKANISSDGKVLPAGITYLSSAMPKISLNDLESTDEEIMRLGEDALSRSGLILNDEKILNAISHSSNRDFLLGISKNKENKYVGKALIDAESFGELNEQIKQTLTDIAERIYQGIADCAPLEYGSQDPCKYCAVKAMCRKNDLK